MSTQTNVITLEQLGQQFPSLFKRRVFRLETKNHYDAENEREPYARFLAGEPVDPAWREPWKKLVREVRASGRIMERVQVVNEPASDYQLFALLHGKPASVEAGEDVGIIDRLTAVHAGLSSTDFWLFDDDLAARLAYDAKGRVTYAFLESEPKVLPWYRAWRDKALSLSVPLAQYVTEHHIAERKHAA